MPAATGLAGLLIVFLVLTPLAGASTYEVWMDGLYDADFDGDLLAAISLQSVIESAPLSSHGSEMRSLPSALPETTRRPISPIPPRRRPEHLQRREPVAVMRSLLVSRRDQRGRVPPMRRAASAWT